MKSLALIFVMLFTANAMACGHKKYDLQTELEIDGEVFTPQMVVTDSETAVMTVSEKAAKSTSVVETKIQVLATELWDETHQGDAVKLQYKVYRTEGRRSLLAEDFAVIAKYDQTTEMTITPNPMTSRHKNLRFKVTAKKI